MDGLTLGLDAELSFYNKQGEFVHASTIVNGLHNKFGVDGCSAIGEIRPTPADCPVELVSNIRKAMQYRLTRTPRLKAVDWRAGGWQDGHPLGAHIHFGHPTLQRQTQNYSATHRSLARVLDAVVLPVATVMENPVNAKHRRTRYGRPTDVREQPHGCEYRSCSSFIASPATALFVLTCAWAVAHDFMDGVLGNWERFAFSSDSFLIQPHSVSGVLMEERLKFLRGLTRVREGVYREVMEAGCVMVSKAQFEQVKDMKSAWKLNYESDPAPRPLSPEAAWAEVSR